MLKQHVPRRGNSFTRQNSNLDSSLPAAVTVTTTDAFFSTPKSTASIFWTLIHAACCIVSLVFGFRFSRVAFFLLFSSSLSSITPILHHTADVFLPTLSSANYTAVPGSRVVVGRHGIRIRPWPHPNPSEVMTAHAIIDRVQKEQRLQYGIRNPRSVIAITPTYVRTFQTLHLTGLMHSLMLLPYNLTWVVVEAGGVSNETKQLLGRTGLLNILHIGIDDEMPVEWEGRHRLEVKMRFKGLREVRERRLDGIVVFADDSNMHSMEMFDEIQKVNWFGALSVGILAQTGKSNSMLQQGEKNEPGKENHPVPVQGPACNSSQRLVGWHTFNNLPYAGQSAILVGDDATVLPTNLEWSGFVLNSRLVWKDSKDKPEWVRDLDEIEENGEQFGSPLVLVKDSSFVEPLGNCGKKVMLWWLRVEARSDSKFPPGWVIDPPLEVVVPAKRTPWPIRVHGNLSAKISSSVSSGLERAKRLKGRSSRSHRASRRRKHGSHSIQRNPNEK